VAVGAGDSVVDGGTEDLLHIDPVEWCPFDSAGVVGIADAEVVAEIAV